MNGDIVCNSLTVLNHTKSTSPGQDEKRIKLTQEGRCPPIITQQNEAPWQGEDRRANTITTPKDSKSQCSPCWTDEQPSPPQLYCPQACLRSSTEPSLPLSNSLCHTLLLTGNNSALHGRKRRDVRPKVGGKKPPRRIAAGKNSQNRKVTDYYPIRRSSRKSIMVLKVQHIEGKGRAVFATRCFQKGEYVVEYHGDLLQITDAKKREAEYAQNPATGCYMYYFQYLCKTYCVDATKESGRMGRLINHSKNGNCQTKLHDINGVPHLILVASRDIDEGEELLYDYGDRSKASIAAHPWLKY
ncbi:N-lysine methyltransferase KMT5A-A isoform X1 [Paralichthys olivaceus]|uniref:N-lysine methyltransferase KMT5A-A isoform X1 n=1 Tax=Paralichthys olivaceus TaxID=8255 RepID=UPI00097D81CE|nr:PREDICTED: N-lysine methyltransferase KMT5A isoform X2 [Paralichthys olivaceus]